MKLPSYPAIFGMKGGDLLEQRNGYQLIEYL